MRTKTISTNALGIALFAVLFLIHIPFLPNYYLCLSYVVMMVFCCYFDLASAILVSSAGLVIGSLMIGSYHGLPGWLLGNLVVIFVMHYVFQLTSGKRYRVIYETMAGLVSIAIGILVVKALVETVLYGVPYLERVAHNFYAFVADFFTILIGIVVIHNNQIRTMIEKLKDD